jgi:hypothetical protein
MRLAVAVHLDGDLVMEGLLSVERKRGRRLDIRKRHRLLGPRLVHWDGIRPILSEGRFLRQWVRLRMRQIFD